jgi:hypothetical protein
MSRGLCVEVFVSQFGSCSNGGISSRCVEVILVGDGMPELSESSAERPAVRLVRRMLPSKLRGGERVEYVHAEPVDGRDSGRAGWMFGGALLYTSDSRFPSEYPIKLHDRQE